MHFQWHILDHCNLRCKHCYQEEIQTKMSYDKALEALDKMKTFADYMDENDDIKTENSIALTGGEPLLYDKLIDLCKEINDKGFSLRVLTNGTVIDEAKVEEFKELPDLEFIQISLDGLKETHDYIRGEGNFDKAVEGLKILIKAGIKTSVSFTANDVNYKEFYGLAEYLAGIDADFIWTDRMVPMGNGIDMPIITTEHFKELLYQIEKAKNELNIEVGNSRALQFMFSGQCQYSCHAGNHMLIVMPNGDILPCRRMPVKVGNIFEDDLKKVYFDSPFLKYLRNDDNIDESCKTCSYVKKCKGGLKCVSYALTGNPFMKDINCFLR